MPTAHPRLNVVLENPLMRALEALASRDGVSLSHKARDLIIQAIEVEEDAGLDALMQDRMKRSGQGHSLADIKRRFHIK